MKRYLFFIEYDYCFAVLRPIQEEIRRRGGETAWLAMGSEVNLDFLREDERCFGHVREAIDWNPYAVLVPGNRVPRFIPGLKIEVFHGLNSGKRRRRDGVQYHFIIRGLFDLYCTHGPNTTLRFQQLADKHGHFRVAETGWPKLDPLFDGSLAIERSDRPCVLFTSTFTDRLSAAPVVLDTVTAMADKGRWKWLVNLHPKMPPEIVRRYQDAQGPNLTLVRTDNVLPLLAEADVMLGDTSSILSEFMVQEKPVVTFRTATPLDCVIDVQETSAIESALEHALQRPPDLMARVRRYVDDTHPYRDGRSSERTLDAIDDLAERGRHGLKRKPLNFFRHRQMKQLLEY